MADEEIREGREAINVPLEYVGIDEAPLIFANNFLAQAQQDEIVLLIGQVAPPIVTGNREEQLEQLRRIVSVRSQIVARFVFSRTRLDELITTLEDIRTRSDQARQEAQQ